MNLDGCVSLVTGASRRLGKGIATALAGRGSHVAVHYGGSRDLAEATAAELRSLGVEAETFGADLRHPAEIDRLFAELAERFERLDVLVNSAASFERGAFEEIGTAAWDEVQALNLRAPFLCLQGAAPLMRRVPRADGAPAAAVNVADLSGLLAWSDQAHHGASKAALLHLTRLAARDLAPGLRVNAVVPGPILPPPGMGAEDPRWRQTVERLPLRRAGSAAEVGEAVTFLASNDFVTGTTLVVDGGEQLLGAAHH
jgi:NAD(P)-dependent dehydrogenase (short-subunit alcohol dehydrogenase family)